VDARDAVGQRGRARLQDVHRLDLVQLAVTHRSDAFPARPRADALGTKLLAAPGAEDDIGRATDDLGAVGDHASRRTGGAGALGKDILAARDRDQLAHPADAADHRLVPFFEIDARPPGEALAGLADSIEIALQPCNQTLALRGGADHGREREDHRQDLVDRALVEDHHI